MNHITRSPALDGNSLCTLTQIFAANAARFILNVRSARVQVPPAYPPLAANQSIQMESSVNATRMVLNGGYPPQTTGNPRPYGMPPFAQTLSDADISAVVTYIRVSWGNHGSPISSNDANSLRLAPLFD